MPKIRKKTSNRTKLHDRAKKRKAIKESTRKKAKAAKKNPQWKSKQPKDPGIPNDFPYKDQILAEVAEQRRLAAQEKERQKTEKQLARQQAQKAANGEGEEEENDDEATTSTGKSKLDIGADAIAGLSAKALNSGLIPRPKNVPLVEESDEDDDEVPILANRDLPTLQSVLEIANVVLEVVDARDPLEYRSQFLENLVKEQGKKTMLVVNKIDACPRETVSPWLAHLRLQQPTFLFRSSTAFLPSAESATPSQIKGKGKSKAPTDDAEGADSILACLGQWAQEKNGDLVVAVVGVTNAGKSSLINSLLKRPSLPIYSLASSSRGPTTTELPQEVVIESNGKQIRIVDTPGFSFSYDSSDENSDRMRGRDILLRNRGRIDKLKDPSLPVEHIVARANNEDLMLLYNLPAFAKGDPNAFLSGVARTNRLVKKKGDLDLTGANRIVLRDWSSGKLARYAMPPPQSPSDTATPPAKESVAEEWLQKLYANDGPILASLRPRKELRKAGGLVRFTSGSIDARTIDLNEPWAALDESDDEESEEDEEFVGAGMDVDENEETSGDEEAEGSDSDEEDGEAGLEANTDSDEGAEEEEDSDEEEPALPLPVSKKQKRKRGAEILAPPRPAKKVAFAAKSSSRREPLVVKQTKAALPPSALKKTEPLPASKKPSRKPERAAKKVANVSSSKKPPTAPAKEGSEAYDFGKFFK